MLHRSENAPIPTGSGADWRLTYFFSCLFSLCIHTLNTHSPSWLSRFCRRPHLVAAISAILAPPSAHHHIAPPPSQSDAFERSGEAISRWQADASSSRWRCKRVNPKTVGEGENRPSFMYMWRLSFSCQCIRRRCSRFIVCTIPKD